MKFRNLQLAALLFASSQLFATGIGLNTPDCKPDTLANYMTNHGFGPRARACKIGSLIYNEFFFESLAVSSNTSPTTVYGAIDPALIWISPDASRSAFDYFPTFIPDPLDNTQNSNKDLFNRSVNPGEWQRHFFSYKADPPPIIAGDELFLDPPVGPVYGTKWICADRDFGPVDGGQLTGYASTLNRLNYNGETFKCAPGGGLSDGPPAYIIKTDGDPDTSAGVRDNVIFETAASVINVIILLDYESNSNGTRSTIRDFQGVQTPVILTIPEPANVLLMGSSLVALLAMIRRRKL